MEVCRCRWRTSNHENGEFGRGRRVNLGTRLYAEVAAGWKPAVPGWGGGRWVGGIFVGAHGGNEDWKGAKCPGPSGRGIEGDVNPRLISLG